MLYFVSPGGASMVDAGGKNFVYWSSRTQENANLDAFSPNFVFVPQINCCSADKWRGPWPTRPLGCEGSGLIRVAFFTRLI